MSLEVRGSRLTSTSASTCTFHTHLTFRKDATQHHTSTLPTREGPPGRPHGPTHPAPIAGCVHYSAPRLGHRISCYLTTDLEPHRQNCRDMRRREERTTVSILATDVGGPLCVGWPGGHAGHPQLPSPPTCPGFPHLSQNLC